MKTILVSMGLAVLIVEPSTALARTRSYEATAHQVGAPLGQRAHRTVRVAWSHQPYRDQTCLDALGRAVPCNSVDAVRMVEEAGEEVTVTVANRTEVPLDCSVKGDGPRTEFQLPPMSVANNATVKLSTRGSQLVYVACQSQTGKSGHAPITFVYDYQTGKIR